MNDVHLRWMELYQNLAGGCYGGGGWVWDPPREATGHDVRTLPDQVT